MKVAIIATDCAEIEEILTDLAREDRFAVISIEPKKELMFDALKKISQLPKVSEVRIHADKLIADYAENAKLFFGFEMTVLPIERRS